ncbi:Rho GTPase activation protein [Flagelloscypha sp. PMI_526]|nr:Rho GTPase activation protein [Flagelloscypha sp. PMI_526]
MAESPPSKASLKAWWASFTNKQKATTQPAPYKPSNSHTNGPIFGKPLEESLRCAHVQISTGNSSGNLYVWGHVPVVVAKCGLFLKERATDIEGVFRVPGSGKRMRELQLQFELPPRYGKQIDWAKETYTPHDVASVFRRFLTQMPEPVIPLRFYDDFRSTIRDHQDNPEQVINVYKQLIRSMPPPNQWLLLYILDLLSVFAKKSDKNRMTAQNLAVIFRPGIISHPNHEMSPQDHGLSQKALEFLIAEQDYFMLETAVSPPSQVASSSMSALPGSSTVRNSAKTEDGRNLVTPPPATDAKTQRHFPGWKSIARRRSVSPTSKNKTPLRTTTNIADQDTKAQRRKTVASIADPALEGGVDPSLSPVSEDVVLSLDDVNGDINMSTTTTVPEEIIQHSAEGSEDTSGSAGKPSKKGLLRKTKRTTGNVRPSVDSS